MDNEGCCILSEGEKEKRRRKKMPTVAKAMVGGVGLQGLPACVPFQ